ncbi:hypothetical protein HAX54_028631 [Datura stramonium]|uniref:Uncharacterized protein n=1 Tax=Datura stramonium TaxID=4076 RepID=A0ABS8V6N4_DATST|nr:hypothetical protein [Datura stramonium]
MDTFMGEPPLYTIAPITPSSAAQPVGIYSLQYLEDVIVSPTMEWSQRKTFIFGINGTTLDLLDTVETTGVSHEIEAPHLDTPPPSTQPLDMVHSSSPTCTLPDTTTSSQP